MSRLIESLRSVVSLTPEEQSVILGFFRSAKYRKGDYFLKAGMVCRKVGFIETGAVYYSLNSANQNNICDFLFENQWCTYYRSLNSGNPSDMDIIALEDCSVLEIEANRVEDLVKRVPKVQEIRMKMAEASFIEMSQRSIDLTSKSAEERYSKLIESKPHIIQRVPLSFVASYLGMTQRHLSRLRATVR